MSTFAAAWAASDDPMTSIGLMNSYTLPTNPSVLYPTVVGGLKVRGIEPSLGAGEFVFAQAGAAGVVAGSVVEILPGTITIGSSVVAMLGVQLWQGGANKGKTLAVALAAVASGSFGWFQVRGMALVNTQGSQTAGDPAYWQANGIISSTGVASKQMVSAQNVLPEGSNFGQAVSGVVPTLSATQGVYYISDPNSQGAIT